MKINIVVVILVSGVLVACGPASQPSAPEKAAIAASIVAPTGPEYDSTGVIATIDGQTLTLDHEGASAAQLAPGRNVFTAYADVLAQAPVTPGARVSFKFRKAGGGYELSELKGR